LLRPAFATAFASLLRSYGTMTNPRRHCVLAKSEEKRRKERKMLKGIRQGGQMRKRGGQTSRRVASGRKGGMLKEYGVRVGWRSLAADYTDHCARTTASVHVGEWNRIEQGKERNAVLSRGFLNRKGSKVCRKGIVIVGLIRHVRK